MPSFLLLPGLACDAELWREQRPALERFGPVAVADVHERFPTLPAMAAALLAEHPGRHVLIGASMGGMLALHVQRLAPARVAALALFGTTARADTPQQLRLRTGAIALLEQGRLDELLQAGLVFALHPDRGRDVALTERYLSMLRRAGAAQLVRQNRAVMARADLRDGLAQVDCPTLVAVGEADVLTPPERSVEIAAAIRGARLELVAGAGHMLTMEQPARVNALLARWLEGLAIADADAGDCTRVD